MSKRPHDCSCFRRERTSCRQGKDYFGAIEKLYNGFEVPTKFKKPTSSAQTTAVAIEISCPENEFSVVEVCLSKELQYQACPNTVKECRAPHIEVKPVP